jgi:microcystin-dependent protein
MPGEGGKPMKKTVSVGVLSAIAVFGLVSILRPAKATSDALPVGTIIAWGGTSSSVPAGWMLCDGRALSKSAYPELFTAIGKSWGGSSAKFNLPDLRGRFLRGDDAGTGRDPDAKKRTPSNPGGNATGVGSVQGDSLQNHKHDQTSHSHTYGGYQAMASFSVASVSSTYYAVNANSWTDSITETSLNSAIIKGATKYNTKSKLNAGEETRPKNADVNFIIKVK